MSNKFLLTGPQAIGKTQAAARIAGALGLSNVVDDWISSNYLPDNTLAINNDGLPLSDGWDDVVVLQASSSEYLQALIQAIERVSASAAHTSSYRWDGVERIENWLLRITTPMTETARPAGMDTLSDLAERNFLAALDKAAWAEQSRMSEEERAKLRKSLLAYVDKMERAIYLAKARLYFEFFILQCRRLRIQLRYISLRVKDKLFGVHIPDSFKKVESRSISQDESLAKEGELVRTGGDHVKPRQH